MTPQPAPIGFASARWLLAAVGTSKLGGLSFGVVATWAIGSALGSDAVGTTNACAGVATLLVGLFGTFWIDRVDRRKLLIAIDVTAAAACGVVSAWQFTHPGSVSLAQIATLMILLAALAALYSPSSRALTPLITDPRSLIRVNSAYAIVSEVARSAGPVVGAALLLGGDAGLPAATAVNGISFLVSAALTMAVSTRCAEAPTDRSEKRLELILGGVRFLKLDRALSREVVVRHVTELLPHGADLRAPDPIHADRLGRGGVRAGQRRGSCRSARRRHRRGRARLADQRLPRRASGPRRRHGTGLPDDRLLGRDRPRPVHAGRRRRRVQRGALHEAPDVRARGAHREGLRVRRDAGRSLAAPRQHGVRPAQQRGEPAGARDDRGNRLRGRLRGGAPGFATPAEPATSGGRGRRPHGSGRSCLGRPCTCSAPQARTRWPPRGRGTATPSGATRASACATRTRSSSTGCPSCGRTSSSCPPDTWTTSPG
ncbi:MFS transporter [Clavibacter capsici]|uniref:MFS transporter n=1 Tax=Clavibacter capsici TaxID=1874630 RepID=A0AAE6XTW9_9MICO|nr:MFS transporter [Clavibacter capsici]